MIVYWGTADNPQQKKIGEYSSRQDAINAMEKYVKSLNFTFRSFKFYNTSPARVDYGSTYKSFFIFE